MCGIAGILIRQDEQTLRHALTRMVDAQTHRGPNDRGMHVRRFGDYGFGLGHTRLSIIDLSCAGHQPMTHPATGSQIVFNGEIYNFASLRRELESAGEVMTGHSDTEVLLHALVKWGPACLARLEGMYAFGFYSGVDRTLLLARDPMGIKPLYVAERDGGVLFASEVRAIVASGLVPARLDMAGTASLLAYGAVQQPCTILQGVRSFPSGHYQIFALNDSPPRAAAPVALWTVPAAPEPIPLGDAVDRTRQLLECAVRDHLVSDVPVGIALSSGLDSTIIAAIAGKHTPHLRSFTIGFGDQPDLSELAMAKRTAEVFSLDHTEVIMDGPDAEEAARQWLGSLDQPSVDGLNIYIIAKAMRGRGISVALSGQGGDEMFGGYSSFGDVPRLRSLMRLIRWLPRSARGVLARLATTGRSEAVRQKFTDILNSGGSLQELYFQRRRAMSQKQLLALGIDARTVGLTRDFVPAESIADLPLDPSDPVWGISLFESRFYQGNMLLRDADVNGMAHSLEIRVPFLDQRIVDFAMRLPDAARLPDGRPNKHLMRAAFADVLRREVLDQPKRGFTLPIRRWMLGPIRDMCETALSNLKSTGALDPAGIEAIWTQFLSAPESPVWTRAFTLCVLGSYIPRVGIVR